MSDDLIKRLHDLQERWEQGRLGWVSKDGGEIFKETADALEELGAMLGRCDDDLEKQRAEIERLRQIHLTMLSEFYKTDPCRVAEICDEVLDKSGALLGEVREAAR